MEPDKLKKELEEIAALEKEHNVLGISICPSGKLSTEDAIPFIKELIVSSAKLVKDMEAGKIKDLRPTKESRQEPGMYADMVPGSMLESAVNDFVAISDEADRLRAENDHLREKLGIHTISSRRKMSQKTINSDLKLIQGMMSDIVTFNQERQR